MDSKSQGRSPTLAVLARIGLFMLPVLAVVGPNLPIVSAPGLNLFAYRLAVLLFASLPLVVNPRLSWVRDGPIRLYAVVGIVWISWSALSAFWVANIAVAAVEALAVTFGFLTALALVNLRAYTEHRLRWLLRGWIAGAGVAAAVAVWELTTGSHLPSHWVNAAPSHASSFIAIATFGNPNNYGAFLVLVTAIALYLMETTRSRLTRWLLFGVLLSSIVLCVLTTSKLAVAGILVVLAIHFLRGVRYKLAAGTLIAAIVLSVYGAWKYLSATIPLLAELATLSASGLEDAGLVRLNLIRAGIEMTIATYGVGVGGGNYSYLMQGGYSKYPTRHVIDPHNWWIEVLSQYGIVVFTLYVAFFLYLVASAERISHQTERYTGRFILLFVVAFALAGFESSSYMLQSTNWLFVATILIMVSAMRRTGKQTSG